MSAQPPTARLMGRSGELAGSTFDLGPDNTIGRDASNRVAVDAASFSARFARIFLKDGEYHLEDLGGQGRTRVDGTPVQGTMRLGRLHVIELADGVELVFSRASTARATEPPRADPASAAADRPSPPTPPPAEPPRSSGAPPLPPPPEREPDRTSDPDPGHTVLDMAGFGALPDLGKGRPPPKEEPPAEPAGTAPEEPPEEPDRSSDPDPGHTVLDMAGFGALPDLGKGKPPPAEESPEAPAGKAPEELPKEPDRSSDPDPGHTVLDMAGFGSLPDLAKGRTPPPEQESPGDASKERAKDPPREPPGEGGAPAGPDPGQTILDMAGFGALPEVRKGEPPRADPPADDPGATRAVPRPRFELAVTLPERGPSTFPLKHGDNVVGRGEDCDVTIFDPEMWLSRRHVIVRVRGDDVELVDLKGVNGTFVQGKRIETAVLTAGSTFSLGPHLKFTVQEI